MSLVLEVLMAKTNDVDRRPPKTVGTNLMARVIALSTKRTIIINLLMDTGPNLIEQTMKPKTVMGTRDQRMKVPRMGKLKLVVNPVKKFPSPEKSEAMAAIMNL